MGYGVYVIIALIITVIFVIHMALRIWDENSFPTPDPEKDYHDDY